MDRYLCPLDCGWHHDQEDLTLAPAVGGMPLLTPDLAYVLGLRRLHGVEAILRTHLETHGLIEWVSALADARAQVDRLRAELAEAVAHDRQPYPTAHAYEQVCKALEKTRAELERANAHNRQRPCTYKGPHPCHLQGDSKSLYHCPGVVAAQEQP